MALHKSPLLIMAIVAIAQVNVGVHGWLWWWSRSRATTPSSGNKTQNEMEDFTGWGQNDMDDFKGWAMNEQDDFKGWGQNDEQDDFKGWGMNEQDDFKGWGQNDEQDDFKGWGQNEQDDFKGWGMNDQDDFDEQNDELDDFKGWGQNDQDDDYDDERDARASEKTEYINAAVNMHNKFRKQHGSPPMQADTKLNKKAQAYAEVLGRKGGALTHSKDPEVSENLHVTTRAKDKTSAVKQAIQSWYDEVKKYDFKNPGFRHGIGHFTALVWKESTKLGIGVAKVTGNGKMKGGWMVVANYAPKGNIRGKFPANVKQSG